MGNRYYFYFRTDDRLTSRPTVPVVSPVFENGGSGNGYPSSDTDDELSTDHDPWEKDNRQTETTDNNSLGGADPSLPWETNLRLPRSVIPNHYDLYLFPDLQSGMFSGKFYVSISCSFISKINSLHILKQMHWWYLNSIFHFRKCFDTCYKFKRKRSFSGT